MKDIPIILTYGSVLDRTGLPPGHNVGSVPDCPCGCGGKASMLIDDKERISKCNGGSLFRNRMRICFCICNKKKWQDDRSF